MFFISYQKNKETSTLQSYHDDGSIETQEVEQIVKIQKRHFKKGTFYMETIAFNDLILDNNYSSIEIKVLYALKSRIDYNNRIKGFKQTEIAERIGSSQANVSRAVKKLLEDKIIFQDGVDYYFNDKYIKYSGDDGKANKN